MITNADIAKLRSVFATKEELSGSEKRLSDKIVSFKDEILAEIQNVRADVAIVTGYRDMIEQHDVDIETIKKHLKLSSS